MKLNGNETLVCLVIYKDCVKRKLLIVIKTVLLSNFRDWHEDVLIFIVYINVFNEEKNCLSFNYLRLFRTISNILVRV